MSEIFPKERTWEEKLSHEIEVLKSRYPEVSFAKISKMAVHIARWQREETLKAVKNEINYCTVNRYQFPILHVMDYINKELGVK